MISDAELEKIYNETFADDENAPRMSSWMGFNRDFYNEQLYPSAPAIAPQISAQPAPSPMAMQPDQYNAYMQWVNAGARGSPPSWIFDNRAQLQQQEQQRQQALALAQQSGMSNAFDMQGTGYGGGFAPPPPPPPAPVQSGMGLQGSANPTGPAPAPGSAVQPVQSITNAPMQTQVAGPAAPQVPADHAAAPTVAPVAAGSYDDQLIAWLNGGQQGPAPTPPASATQAPVNHAASNGQTANSGMPTSWQMGGGGSANTNNDWAFLTGAPVTQPYNYANNTNMTVGAPGSTPPPATGGPSAGGVVIPPSGGSSAGTGGTGNTNVVVPPAGGGRQTGGGLSTGTTGLPDDVTHTWPTGGAGIGPTYAGNVRDLGGELGAISAYPGPYAERTFSSALNLNPKYTQLNTANFNSALGNISGSMRDAYNAANPNVAAYEGALGQTLMNLSGSRPGPASVNTFEAAMSGQTAAPTAAMSAHTGAPSATTAGFGSDRFGPMSVNPNTGYSPVSAQASDFGLQNASNQLRAMGPSDIQQTLEGQARGDLALGKSLSAEDIRNSQQSAREGWSARGLINSTGAVAEEVLNRDAMGRQREAERRGFAQGVDNTGFNQRLSGFQGSLGLSNAAQGYAGLGLQAQQANLGAQLAGNQLGLQGQLANQGNTLNYAQLYQSGDQFNAAQQNAMSQFGSQLGQTNNQFNASQQNAMNQFGSQLGQANNQFNATQLNQAGAANANSRNQMNQFNAELGLRGNQQDWNNAMQYGQYLQGNAFSPFSTAQGLVGQTPDYTQALMGYGADLYNTNYNAARAAEINAANISAGKASGWMSLAGSIIGGLMPG
jgi:hypothetical protein